MLKLQFLKKRTKICICHKKAVPLHPQKLIVMKKYLLFIAALLSVGLSFTACDKTPGDVLQGTWKNVPGYVISSGGEEEPDMTYIFDGKGNYTFISKYYDEVSTTKGSYVIAGNLVHMYYTKQNMEGETINGEDVLELDTDRNPPALTAELYTSDGIHIGTLLFEKQ